MFDLPKNLKKISLFLEQLPGIGEKTANRLALYMLRLPETVLLEFSQAIANLKSKTKLCKRCFNLTENDYCQICSDSSRDQTTIIVVEQVYDILSFERGRIYHGLYHVLHGRIDPLNHIGPEDIKIGELLNRMKKEAQVKEIILATNPNLEGEATAMFIKEKIEKNYPSIKISRIGYGLPIGASIEYADYMTLKKSLEGRMKY